jgi:hypothetical protein
MDELDELKNEMKILGMMKEMMDEDDYERRRYLADNILEIDPCNAIAKYVKWQSMDDPAALQDSTLLEEAINLLRPKIESLSDSSAKDIMTYSMYVCMLSDLASLNYLKGNRDVAFEAAAEFMRLDRDGDATARAVYYASLFERGEFEEIIRAVDDDTYETLPGEHCRAMAVFELDGYGERAARCLINAIAIDPDAPYYILGIWSLDYERDNLDDDDDGYIEETMITIPVLSELWSADEERLAFLSAVAFTFGYITGRVGPDDMRMVEDCCEDLGWLDEIQESRDILHAMLVSGLDKEEVDEKALSMFAENDYFGLLE